MANKPFISILLIFFFLQTLFAQDEKPTPTFALTFNQDASFGFYPGFYGSLGIDANTRFTYYSLFWTNPAFGSAATGNNFWTETGFGFLWYILKNRATLNPSLGFTHGLLLSGGAQGVIGDGIVPGLTGYYLDSRFETELFFAYYKALRKEGPVTYDYILTWIYPGILITPAVSVGFHYENFILTRSEGGNEGIQYTWTGGYVKVTHPRGYSIRFSAGANLEEGSVYSDEYYRVNVVVPL